MRVEPPEVSGFGTLAHTKAPDWAKRSQSGTKKIVPMGSAALHAPLRR